MRALLASVAVLILSASAANAALYFSYTDSVNSPTGDNKPSIANGTDRGSTVSLTNGLAKGSSSSPDAPTVTTSWSTPQLLFQVDPQSSCGSSSSCNPAHGDKTSNATVTVTFNFYSSSAGGTSLGSLTETAQADFDYTLQKDNICWNSVTTGGILLSSTQTGVCSPTYSQNTGDGNDVIDEIQLSGTDYDIEFNGWNDWNEQPSIQFKDVPATVPEPASIAFLGSGLLGLGFRAYRRRKRV